MAYGNQVREYQKNQALGASPVGLIVMLYDGALRFMEQGKREMAAGNIQQQNHALQKAQRIVTELMTSLDMHRGGEIAKNLFALYTYIQGELVTANVEDRPESIDRAMSTLSNLREGWAELERTSRNPVGEPIASAA